MRGLDEARRWYRLEGCGWSIFSEHIDMPEGVIQVLASC
jgi:hypothetical protein